MVLVLPPRHRLARRKTSSSPISRTSRGPLLPPTAWWPGPAAPPASSRASPSWPATRSRSAALDRRRAGGHAHLAAARRGAAGRPHRRGRGRARPARRSTRCSRTRGAAGRPGDAARARSGRPHCRVSAGAPTYPRCRDGRSPVSSPLAVGRRSHRDDLAEDRREAVDRSVGLLSDAAESVVNLVAAIVALSGAAVGGQTGRRGPCLWPRQGRVLLRRVEGALIFVAATVIAVTATARLLRSTTPSSRSASASPCRQPHRAINLGGRARAPARRPRTPVDHAGSRRPPPDGRRRDLRRGDRRRGCGGPHRVGAAGPDHRPARGRQHPRTGFEARPALDPAG